MIPITTTPINMVMRKDTMTSHTMKKGTMTKATMTKGIMKKGTMIKATMENMRLPMVRESGGMTSLLMSPTTQARKSLMVEVMVEETKVTKEANNGMASQTTAKAAGDTTTTMRTRTIVPF